MRDPYGRKINYMRISITDRCNLRCRYCMPEDIENIPAREILSFEEILMVCRAAVSLGITRFKLTGGEPLVRRGCSELAGKIRKIPGVEQITLTTNGIGLKKNLPALLESRIDGVNISLDTLDSEQYRQITGRDGLTEILDGLEAAVWAGIRVKVNCVMQKGVTEEQWPYLIGLAKEHKVDVRFIEIMPIGYGREYISLSAQELFSLIAKRNPNILSDKTVHGNGPAVYYRIPGFLGSIGFISAMHGKLCSRCNRIRMTAQGDVKPCLCYEESISLKPVLRSGADDREKFRQLRGALYQAVMKKPDQHCFEQLQKITETHKMIQIGG